MVNEQPLYVEYERWNTDKLANTFLIRSQTIISSMYLCACMHACVQGQERAHMQKSI